MDYGILCLRRGWCTQWFIFKMSFMVHFTTMKFLQDFHTFQPIDLALLKKLANWMYIWCLAPSPNPLPPHWYTWPSTKTQYRLKEIFYYGWFVSTWTTNITATHPTIHGILFYSWMLTDIWQINQSLHPLNQCKVDETQLQNTVYIYKMKIHQNKGGIPLVLLVVSFFFWFIVLAHHSWTTGCV